MKPFCHRCGGEAESVEISGRVKVKCFNGICGSERRSNMYGEVHLWSWRMSGLAGGWKTKVLIGEMIVTSGVEV